MSKKYENYKGRLPKELIDYAKEGKWQNGLISLCNPDDYIDVLSSGYKESSAIPFAVTAFGDFLVWEKDKYVSIVSFSKQTVQVLESGFEFFFKDLEDRYFVDKYLNGALYDELCKKQGTCNDGECFVASPMPALSGEKTRIK